jgi:hypothetical protein
MLAPARIPVTAGKKTAKTPQKSMPLNPSSMNPGYVPHQVIFVTGCSVTGLPKIEISDAAITAMMRNWTRKARLAPTYAMARRTTNVKKSTRIAGWWGKIHRQPSRKPMICIAVPSARAR